MLQIRNNYTEKGENISSHLAEKLIFSRPGSMSLQVTFISSVFFFFRSQIVIFLKSIRHFDLTWRWLDLTRIQVWYFPWPLHYHSFRAYKTFELVNIQDYQTYMYRVIKVPNKSNDENKLNHLSSKWCKSLFEANWNFNCWSIRG